MKKKPIAAVKFLVLFLFSIVLFGCKNEDKNSEEIASGGNNFPETTATELETVFPSIPENELIFRKEVQEFYQSRSFEPAWNDEANRSALIEEFARASEEGLPTSEYYNSKIEKLIEAAEEMTSEERATLEFLLTDAFFKYGSHLFYGKVNPKDLYSLWGLKRKEIDLVSILEKAVKENKIPQALDYLKPAHPIYAGLKESLQEYKLLKENEQNLTKIEEGGTIRPGTEDPRVPKIALRLQELEYLSIDSILNDSLYGEIMTDAIKEFQEKKGLQPDGIIGNSTLRELNMDNTQRYNKILVNLERWRWYPRDLGEHYIIVNVADFKLAVVKNGDTVRTHNVIAGSKARQTPVFTDTLEYIVINPVWNIPPTIRKEDIIPKASRNPSYLTNNNISVTGPNGEKLDPDSIDWSDPEVRSYRYSQSAGPSNPLGRVKIIYPNRYLIYLHDTPSKALFQRNDRAERSGGVLVEGAIDLAAYVVSDQEGWDLEKIQSTIASGKTKHVKINQPIQVHHLYWTAWRGQAKTYFSDDVYDFDQEVYQALTKS